MADQAIQTKVNEAKAETLPAVDAPRAPVAEAAKPAPAKAEAAARAVAPAKKAAVKTARRATKRTRVAAKPAMARKTSAKAKAKPARAGRQAINAGVKIMNKQTHKAAETAHIAAEQIKTAFEATNERAKTAMEKSTKIVEEFAELTRGNVEAIVASSKVAAKGVEGLSQDAANFSRKSFEDASAAFKSFADIKSATDFFKLQGDFARSAFDAAVAQSARVSETVLKLAGDVAEPLTSRYTVAAERVKTLAA